MLIFLCICAGLTTAALIIVAIYLVMTTTQMRRTARTLESLASNANEKVNTFNGMFDTIRSVSKGVRSGWFKGIQFALGLVSAYRAQRRQSAPHPQTHQERAVPQSGAAQQERGGTGNSRAAEQDRNQSAGQRQHAWHDSAEDSPASADLSGTGDSSRPSPEAGGAPHRDQGGK